jgi:hypothetical protein
MAAPNSNGVLRTKLADMKIGDYIKWQYNGGSNTTIGTLKADDGTGAELPSTPLDTGIAGYFYFIKWKQGLLVADRGIHLNISAQMINKAGYFKGSQYFCPSFAQFQAFCADDFNGNFKFSNANFPIATGAGGYVGNNTTLTGRPITQDLKIVREQGDVKDRRYDTTDYIGFAQIGGKMLAIITTTMYIFRRISCLAWNMWTIQNQQISIIKEIR